MFMILYINIYYDFTTIFNFTHRCILNNSKNRQQGNDLKKMFENIITYNNIKTMFTLNNIFFNYILNI